MVKELRRDIARDRHFDTLGPPMIDATDVVGYRFGVFEVDAATGELRRQGLRVKVNVQPVQVLLLLLGRPGEVLSREEIARSLWPEGTFVDYQQGVNSAVNRMREALGDSARNPRFIETLARRGYRFVAPVERIRHAGALAAETPPLAAMAAMAIAIALTPAESFSGFLSTPDELPQTPPRTVRLMFVLLQVMYLGFYVGALANLAEIADILSALPESYAAFVVVIVSAALLIPVRLFLLTAIGFSAPGLRTKFLRLWPFLLGADLLWALAPFLLMHHINFGVALACTAPLVYAPFAARALVLMGAAERGV